MKDASIEIRLTKNGPNGGPYAEVLVPAKASLEDLIRAQKVLFTDGLKAVGLRACAPCRSGLDFLIRQKFEKILEV
jgi:hypothetical protein